jgi:hypothetical protein
LKPRSDPAALSGATKLKPGEESKRRAAKNKLPPTKKTVQPSQPNPQLAACVKIQRFWRTYKSAPTKKKNKLTDKRKDEAYFTVLDLNKN